MTMTRDSGLRIATSVAGLALLVAPMARAEDVAQLAKELTQLVRDASSATRAQIMVLGTFHFAGSGTDDIKTGSAGMLTPERQAQIADVVERLKAFRPTKVAVEAPKESEDQINQEFQAYRQGDFELPENEIHQLGFRLAKTLGHEKLYGIDADGRWLEPRIDLEKYAREHAQTALLRDPAEAGFSAVLRKDAELRRRLNLAEYLALLNSAPVLRLHHAIYLHGKLAIGDESRYPGADGFVSHWYNRNLRIYGNLLRISQGKDDRILVIIGAGHAAILRPLLEVSTHFEPVSPLAILGHPEAGR